MTASKLKLATCTANCTTASPTWQIEALDRPRGQSTSLQLASTGNILVSGLPIISYTSATSNCAVTATFIAVDMPAPDETAVPVPLVGRWWIYTAIALLLGAGCLRLRRFGMRK